MTLTRFVGGMAGAEVATSIGACSERATSCVRSCTLLSPCLVATLGLKQRDWCAVCSPGTITYNLHHRYTPPVAAALVARLDAVAAQKFSPLVAYGSPREVAFSALEGTLPPLGSNNSGTSNVTLADLACEQSADARQRAIMWPRTRCVRVWGRPRISPRLCPPPSLTCQ